MMKNIKRILAVCLGIALLFTVVSSSADEEKMMDIKEKNQGTAILYYSEIVNSFRVSSIVEAPDYFAGGNLDEYGNLIIAVKGNLYEVRKKMLETAKNSEVYKSNPGSINTISFVRVKYSLQDLHRAMREVGDFIMNCKTDDTYKHFSNKVGMSGIDAKNNCVNVYFDVYDAELEKLLRERSSYPDALRFIRPEPVTPEEDSTEADAEMSLS